MPSRPFRRPGPARPGRLVALPPDQKLTIGHLGADGDGAARLADGSTAWLPGTLPQEVAEAHILARRGGGYAAQALRIITPSPQRVPPPCRHFGDCGGCALQHWQAAPALAWKVARLTEALRQAGYEDAAPAPIATTPAGARRRLDLAMRRDGRQVVLGLHAAGQARIVDLAECPVAHPQLQALLAPLRGLLASLGTLARQGSAVVNLLESGPDLLLRGDAAISPADRSKLAAFAATHGLARISWALGDDAPQTVCQNGPAAIHLHGVAVQPPPGAFLQASAQAEAAIVAAVLAALPARLPPRAHAVELFAGCGTLTFALAERLRVVAYEGDAASHAALRAAIQTRPITAQLRDLARQPVMAAQLRDAALVLLDPPYAGAAAQMGQIAASGVTLVVYVSCNPAALARDLRPLHAAGYRLVQATPIDQFLWSARLESVVVLIRDKAPRRLAL